MCERFRTSERGIVAVFTVVVIAVLVACMALALNAGHLFAVRGELQNAADAGALAGARTLDGTTTVLSTARDDAEAWGERHSTDTSRQVQITQDGDESGREVDVGYWNETARTFTPYAVSDVTPELASCSTLPCINAVRVVTQRNPTHTATVPVFFGGLLGKSTQDVNSVAIALTGPACGVECADLPIALPSCGVLEDLSTCVEGDYTVRFRNDKTDSGAWTTFQPDEGGGADLIKCFLDEAISNSGECKAQTSCSFRGDLAATQIDPVDPIWVENGQVNTACGRVAQLYAMNPTRQYTVPIAKVPCGPDEKWVGTPPTEDFAVITIKSPPICTGPDQTDGFVVHRECKVKTPHGIPGGCAGSIWTSRARLVR